MCEPPELAGPGFINLRLRDAWLGGRLAETYEDSRLGLRPTSDPQRIVDRLQRSERGQGDARRPPAQHDHRRRPRAAAGLPRARGDRAEPRRRLGDPIRDADRAAARRTCRCFPRGSLRGDPGVPAGAGTSDLNAFYRNAREKFDCSPDFARRARQRVVALQGGDPADARPVAGARGRVGAPLRRRLRATRGAPRARRTRPARAPTRDSSQTSSRSWRRGGLIVESDGALCVFPAGFSGRDGEPLPLIVRKRDGAYNYATTDLAAIRYRVRELGASELLYVVGGPQRLHFEMVFAVAREAGWLGDGVEARHVSFGSVLGEDHKMLRTRSGAPVRLVDLLNEAIERAGLILAERGVEGDDLEAPRPRDRDRGGQVRGPVPWTARRTTCSPSTGCSPWRGTRLCTCSTRTPAPARCCGAAEEDRASAGASSSTCEQPGRARARLWPWHGCPARDRRGTRGLEAAQALYLSARPGGRLLGLLRDLPDPHGRRPRPTRLAPGPRELTSRTLELGLDLLGIEAPERLSDPPQRPSVRGA